MPSSQFNYQVFLKSELDRRRSRNPSYSLRAFARDLGVSISKLSLVLRGKKGLSTESGRKIASQLGLSAQETDFFISLIEAKHSRSRDARDRATEKVTQMRFSTLPLELLKVLTGWQSLAILELTDTVGFKPNAKWIAKKLGIDLETAQEAIQRLFDLKMLVTDKDGRWVQSQVDMATPTDIPSRDIRNYHHQILNKAHDALEEVAIDERDFSSIIFSFDSSQMAVAKKLIQEFRRRLANELSVIPKQKDRVFSLSIQFIPLDKK